MNFGSHQLVSKHSILSAQRKNKVAATEEFLEKQAPHRKPEWKEELDKIKRHLQRRTKDDGGRRWRHDHASCDELSEKDFEIYLEMKLEWLQQFYVTAKTHKPDEEEEPSKKRDIDDWSEEIPSDLVEMNEREAVDAAKTETQEGNLLVAVTKSEVPKEEEGDESKAEHDMSNSKSEGGCDKDGARYWNGGDQKPPLEKSTLDNASSETSEVGETMGEGCVPLESSKQVVSLTNEGCNERVRDDENWGRPPEEEDDGATVEAVGLDRDGGVPLLSLALIFSDRECEGNEASADWISWELGFWTIPMGQAHYLLLTPAQITENEELQAEWTKRRKLRAECFAMKVDLVDIVLGQAQMLVSKSDLFHIGREVLKEKKKGENKISGSDCSFNKVDLNSSKMAQAQTLFITSTSFTSKEGVLQEKRKVENCDTSLLKLSEIQEVGIDSVVCKGVQLQIKGVGKIVKLLMEVGRICGSGLMQSIHVSILVMTPLAHQWDPGGIKQGESILEGATTCACHRNQTPQQQQATQCNKEKKWLKRAGEIEDKKQLPSAHEFLNWKQCIGAEMGVAKGNQCLHAGIVFGDGVESQAWGHTNHCLHSESKITKGVVDLLYEWLMGFVSDSTKMMENKLMEFLKDEENISSIAKFEWHKLMVEHLIQRGESSRIAMAERQHKQWDPGEPYSISCIIGTTCFKLWDPGGRVLIVCPWYLHLEDKVNV